MQLLNVLEMMLIHLLNLENKIYFNLTIVFTPYLTVLLNKRRIHLLKFKCCLIEASIAQWLEHLSRKQGVASSILAWGYLNF